MSDIAVLNVTHAGRSSDLADPIPFDMTDEDVRRTAAECLRLRPGTFALFVVDRFDTPQGGLRVFLRPKVPFGSDKAECDCPGCNTCGVHCVEDCSSGEGEACTVASDEND